MGAFVRLQCVLYVVSLNNHIIASCNMRAPNTITMARDDFADILQTSQLNENSIECRMSMLDSLESGDERHIKSTQLRPSQFESIFHISGRRRHQQRRIFLVDNYSIMHESQQRKTHTFARLLNRVIVYETNHTQIIVIFIKINLTLISRRMPVSQAPVQPPAAHTHLLQYPLLPGVVPVHRSIRDPDNARTSNGLCSTLWMALRVSVSVVRLSSRRYRNHISLSLVRL